MEQKCIFCGDNLLGSRTREHVLPQWLSEFLSISEAFIQPTHFSTEGDVISSRDHPIDQLVCGRVCSTCNNGWMSELESENMDILKSLMQHDRDVADLNEHEKINLARWTCKTAYSLHAASNYRKIVPAQHFIAIKSNCICPGIFVLGKNFNNSPPWVHSTDFEKNTAFSFIQNSTWWIHVEPGADRNEEANGLSLNSYKIGLQLGGLLLLVAFNPLENAQFILDRTFHFPLHPRSGPCSWGTSKTTVIDTNPWKALAQINVTLGLVLFKN